MTPTPIVEASLDNTGNLVFTAILNGKAARLVVDNQSSPLLFARVARDFNALMQRVAIGQNKQEQAA